MARRYCAFMVRCWVLGEGAQRAEIECIPSGEKIAVASLDAALGWMTARVLAPEREAVAGIAGEAEHEPGCPEVQPGTRPASDV